MYLAVNKENPNEYHSFKWTSDKFIVNNVSVNPKNWEVMEVDIIERSSGYYIIGDYGVIDGPFLSRNEIKTK